jgi:hypothetical protein
MADMAPPGRQRIPSTSSSASFHGGHAPAAAPAPYYRYPAPSNEGTGGGNGTGGFMVSFAWVSSRSSQGIIALI